jgi:hypothetical protein
LGHSCDKEKEVVQTIWRASFSFFWGEGGRVGGREIGLNPCAQITEGEKKPNLFLSELIISRRIVEIFYNKKNFNHQNFKKGD